MSVQEQELVLELELVAEVQVHVQTLALELLHAVEPEQVQTLAPGQVLVQVRELEPVLELVMVMATRWWSAIESP